MVHWVIWRWVVSRAWISRMTLNHHSWHNATSCVQWLPTKGGTRERSRYMWGALTSKQMALALIYTTLASCLTMSTTLSNNLSPSLTWRHMDLLETDQEILLTCKWMIWHVQRPPWCRCGHVAALSHRLVFVRAAIKVQDDEDCSIFVILKINREAWHFCMASWLC